jgi:hypothetical protein
MNSVSGFDKILYGAAVMEGVDQGGEIAIHMDGKIVLPA